jgi:hypothetical protein
MKIILHLSAIAIVTIILGLIYVTVQQSYRTGADDPQIQLAHDLGDRLEKGRSISFDDTIDLEKSLAVFKETYNKDGQPIQSTGFLNNRAPKLPEGVFDLARQRGEHSVTWQPKPTVRMAMCIVRVDANPIAYLAVGRSLKQVEERESSLNTMVFIAWVLCICVVLANWLACYYQYRKINIV